MTQPHVIQRKIYAASERLAQASLQNSLVHNIERATSKVFLDLLGMEVGAAVIVSAINSHSNTIESMTSVLFGILNLGDDSGLTGFDAQFIDSAVGVLSGAPHRDKTGETTREPTHTDAALIRKIINAILVEIFASPNAPAPDELPAQHISMEGHVVEKAPLMFLLKDHRYARLRISIQGNGDALFGHFELVLPLACIEKFATYDASGSVEVERQNWQTQMSEAADHAALEMNSIVQQMPVPLSAILGMKKGDLLELSNGTLANLTLEATTNTGPHVVFHGQLGALKTQKAFRITHTPDDIHNYNALPA